ncbi:MAG: aromatic ring-hydroxylating oxygenase subunit alpha [Pseudomonadota bacterium]|jgi:Rieske 2Fe-2S family protein
MANRTPSRGTRLARKGPAAAAAGQPAVARAPAATQSRGPIREPLGRLAQGLPGHWYHDADHHRREVDRIWFGSWIAVARADELAAPGDYRVVDLAGQSLLLVRDDAGAVRAYHNTCRHRGSILCTEASGRLRGGRITCPYHAWSYRLDGRLQSTPRRMPTPDFDADRLGLLAVRADLWGGFVFVNLGTGTVAPLRESLGWMPGRLAGYGLEGLVVGHRLEVEVAADWKLVCENFCECFHCPPVHPELCRLVPAYREGGAWGLRRGRDAAPRIESTPQFRPGTETLTPDGRSRVPPFRGLGEAERRLPYQPALLPPNLFLNLHPDYVNAHLVFPVGPGRVRIVYDWLFEPEAVSRPGFDLEHYLSVWRVTNAQDARNCEWQQRGVTARGFSHGVYVPQEFDCHRFAQWVRAKLRRPSTRQRPL